MKTKRQFILDTLLPYKKDRSLCSIEDGTCLYLSENGNKCAVGKHMKKGEWQKSQSGFPALYSQYLPEEFFKKKALEQNLCKYTWLNIQAYHDAIAQEEHVDSVNSIVRRIEYLTKLQFPELRS